MKTQRTTSTRNFLDTIDELFSYGINKGIGHLSTTDERLKGNLMSFYREGNPIQAVNFGSCSYLGLEFDPRLIDGGKQALECYGTQFSSSRAYVSSRYYEELESLFDQLFDAHVIVTPTTTLGHIAAIPVIVGDNDAIILDHQVHTSVHTAVNLVKTRGVHTELVRHNRMDLLEERIKELRVKFEKVWYMADGIYSMYGDPTPVTEIMTLLEKYPELYFYADDAHGMSCFGTHGQGYVLSKCKLHERMVLVSSMAKGFAAGGGVLVFPDKEMKRKVRTCGGPMITSGPLQPAVLGCAVASAKIHLTDEIYLLQEKLRENIKYAKLLIKKLGLPSVSDSDSPIFFIAVSLPKLGCDLAYRMMNSGYYLNFSTFPAVPVKNTGIRFTITNHHTFTQIEDMLCKLAFHYTALLREENIDIGSIYKAFRMQAPVERKIGEIFESANNESKLKLTHERSIHRVPKDEWDQLLGERGNFNWDSLCFYERVFSGNILPADNWDFDYIQVRELSGKVILATFLTTSLWKEDMLAPEGVSKIVEEKRKSGNPYYLTSKALCMGSPLSAGDHLYIDRSSPLWKDALKMFLEKVYDIQERENSNSIVMRDFPSDDPEMDLFFTDNGYFKIAMPDNHVVDSWDWTTDAELGEHLALSSKRSKRYFRQDVLRHKHKFEAEWISNPSSKQIAEMYRLYEQVNRKSFDINSFPLPYKFFELISSNHDWEILSLKLKEGIEPRGEGESVAMAFCHQKGEIYNFMIVGLDYSVQNEHKAYKQAIYQILKRAKELGKKSLYLGYTASYVKKMTFGARAIPGTAYMQTKDNYSLEVLSAIHVGRTHKFDSSQN